MRRATHHRALLLPAACAAALGREASAFQDTVRASVDSAGVEGNDSSGLCGVSADGRFIAFSSWASNLVAGDNNNSSDVFVFDRATGVTERVSVDSGGYEQIGSSQVSIQPISGDGSLVVFTSAAPLDPNDTNGSYDVYVRDRVAGTTTRASVDSAGNQCKGACAIAVLSQDGRVVAFGSFADDLVAGDTNGKNDVFVHDLASGTTERVSVDSSGAEGNRISEGPSISADGSCVSFCGAATNLVPGDTNHVYDVFVRDRVAGTTERVSVDSAGQQGDDASLRSSISADGRFVAFDSIATNLVTHDGNGKCDVFVHDRATGETTRVSVSDLSNEGDGASGYPATSADGRFVLFQSSATNLVLGDTNGRMDVFLHDREKATTTRISVDSAGAQSNMDSWTGGISGHGEVATFCSLANNLVASDTNNVGDVFFLDPCGLPATWTNYGAGFPGTSGVPALTSRQFPARGATITVDLANSYGQPTIGLLVLGLQRASLPTKWGGDLLVLPTLIAPITFSYGFDSFTGTIPDDVTLCGTTIDLQGIEFDPGAAHGVSFSQGLELVIGS